MKLYNNLIPVPPGSPLLPFSGVESHIKGKVRLKVFSFDLNIFQQILSRFENHLGVTGDPDLVPSLCNCAIRQDKEG